MEFYSGATGHTGRFNEGFCLRRVHRVLPAASSPSQLISTPSVSALSASTLASMIGGELAAGTGCGNAGAQVKPIATGASSYLDQNR